MSALCEVWEGRIKRLHTPGVHVSVILDKGADRSLPGLRGRTGILRVTEGFCTLTEVGVTLLYAFVIIQGNVCSRFKHI